MKPHIKIKKIIYQHDNKGNVLAPKIKNFIESQYYIKVEKIINRVDFLYNLEQHKRLAYKTNFENTISRMPDISINNKGE